MLVIRRRPGEAFIIGDSVEIEILDASPSQVKLGIRAPRSVAVLRKEIQIVGDQNREAARGVPEEAIRQASLNRVQASLTRARSAPISPL